MTGHSWRYVCTSLSADNEYSFVSKLFDISVNVPRMSTYYLTFFITFSNEYSLRHKLFEPIIKTFDVTCVRFRVHSFAAQLLQQKYRSAIKITKWFIFMTFCTFYVNIFRIFYPSDRCCAVQTVASYFIRISYWLCYNMNPTKEPKSLGRGKYSKSNSST